MTIEGIARADLRGDRFGAKLSLIGGITRLKLYCYFNNIGVRICIRNGAPFAYKGHEAGPQVGRSDEVLVNPLGAPKNRAVQTYLNAMKIPAFLRRHRRHQVERPEELPLDHRLAAFYQSEAQIYANPNLRVFKR